MFDIRDFDGEPLLESSDLGDNMLAVLTRFDQERVLRRVEERLRRLPEGERVEGAQMFVVLPGLRDLEASVTERLNMVDIMENKVLGPAVLKGEATMLSTVLSEKFGPLPEWVPAKMQGASEKQLLRWGKKVLTAKSLEAVFRQEADQTSSLPPPATRPLLHFHHRLLRRRRWLLQSFKARS